MDGKSLLYSLRNALNEPSDSDFLDDRTSYEYLWQSAIEFTDRTSCLTTTQSITTVANQAEYTLNADYMKIYLKNSDNNYFIKYNDGTDDQFPTFKEKEDVIWQNSTESVTIPSHFYIEDDPTLDTSSSGAASSTGLAVNNQTILNASAGNFNDASAGDTVSNLTDTSDGYVLSKSSSIQITTRLFGGTNNYWSNADTFMIQPQGRMRLVLSPPPSTASHTITFYYVKRPDPVFSDFGTYRFQPQHMQAIIFYAAWLYKYRDRAPQYGDRFYQYFDNQVRKSSVQINRGFKRGGFKVNLKKRA